MRRADPHRALIRALAARYPGLEIASGTREPWASVTFTGERHRLVCGAGCDLTGIEDEDFAIGGHIIADIVVLLDADATVIEALTIESD